MSGTYGCSEKESEILRAKESCKARQALVMIMSLLAEASIRDEDRKAVRLRLPNGP